LYRATGPLAAAGRAGGVQIDARVVDKPVIERARRIAARGM